MKLKTRIYMISILPLVIVGLATMIITSVIMQQSVLEEAYSGMEATALSIRNIFDYGAEGEYYLDDSGDLWKGTELNISENTNIVDDIKMQTGFDVTIFYGDTRYQTTFMKDSMERQIGTTANPEITKAVLENGEYYHNADTEILGKRYICYYVPYYQEGTQSPVGMVFIGQEYSLLFKEIINDIAKIAIPSVLLILVTIFIAGTTGKRMEQTITDSVHYLNHLDKGHLGFTMDQALLDRPDVIGDMSRSIDSLNRTLSSVIGDIKKQCVVLDESSNTCHQTADSLNDSMGQISAVVQEVAATTTNQAEDAEHANENISAMGELIGTISDDSHATLNSIEKLVEQMKQVEQSVEAISAQTDETNASVDKINSAVELISSISLQTKLLSLNASIEAARAGSYGKGFAVVAEEIQQLAQSSEESSKEIQEVLAELKANSKKSLVVTSEVMESVNVMRDDLIQTEDTFGELLKSIVGDGSDYDGGYIQSSTPSLNEERSKTVTAVNDLAAATEEIAASMEQTSASVQEVALLAETMGNQSRDMKQVSQDLQNDLNHFTIE